MAYAVAAGDTDRAAQIVVRDGFPLYRSGRAATVAKWLARFDDPIVLERYPTVALLGAIVHAVGGHGFQAERWLDAGDRATSAETPAPDGSVSLRAWVAAVSPFLCRNGVTRMREDAELAVAELGPLSPLRAPAMMFLALAHWLEGADDAPALLQEAGEASSLAGATFAGVLAFGQHALLALARDDLAGADASIARARLLVGDTPADEYMPMALLHVASVHRALHTGDTQAASAELVRAHRLRPYLTSAIPHLSLKVLIEMAKAHLELGDAAAARAVLVDATDVLRHRPDLGILGAELEGVRARASAPPAVEGWDSSLTSAELRLLPLLSSHLTFREIGARLFISRNTVKTQAISIYRKLGVTSRSDAVSRAAELGLLESVVDGRGRPFVR
jgi:LuxR family maltose regulon positive regulatory protein